jgi:hypothetical protein
VIRAPVRTVQPEPWERILLVGAACGLAVLLGFALSGSSLPIVGPLPAGALVGIGVATAVLPLALRRFQVAVGLFFAWLVVEDLVRKLAGNDLRAYFVKDLVYAVVLVGLVAVGRKAWREATGSSRLWLYALVGWALLMSIPTAFEDWRLPLLGLRLDFLYAPLVVAGFLLGRERRSLERWLVGLAILGAVAGAVGIAQAVLGPGFLAPDQPTTGLDNLVLVRGLPESGPVYRPTGTFVDPGRFSSMTLVALTVSLSALVVRAPWRLVVWGAAFVSAAAVWVSGGRAGFLVGAFLIAVAAVSVAFAFRRPAIGRAAAAAAAGVVAVGLLAALVPGLFQSRLAWYRETLDPRSAQNEWAFRLESYWGSTVSGVELGGLVGQGTGTESLGKQYLYGGEEQSPAGLYQVEGGYASVAVEWGVVGLFLWTAWSLAWTRRQWRAVQAARGTPLAAAGLVMFGWMLFFLFFGFFGGLQGFQNYLANAYFWLLSGVIFALPRAAKTIRDGA